MRVTDILDRDLDVRAGTPACVVAQSLGLRALWCGDVRLTDDHPAGVAPFVTGARLTGAAGDALVRDGDAHLEVERGPDAGAVVRLDEEGVWVGRDPSADLHIDDPAVSARHVRVRPGRRVAVTDLGSSNGPGPRSVRRGLPPRLEVGRSSIVVKAVGDHGASRPGEASPPTGRAPATVLIGAVTSAVVMAAVTGRWWIAAVALAVACLSLAPRMLRRRAPTEPDPPRTPAGSLAIRGAGPWPAAYARAVALDRGRRLEGVAHEGWMRWLAPPGPDDRVALLGPRDAAPSWADAVVDVDARSVVERAGTSRLTRLPLAITAARADQAARRVAARAGTITLPDTVRWGDLVSTAAVAAPGDEARPLSSAPRRLAATIGAALDGPVELDLDRDGPHVLVAGTTGSGKSVALETLVCALAVTHGPRDLAIALIDFKGGAGLAACATVPQVCATLTDLDEGLAARALVGLAAELRERKQALAQHGFTSWHEWERSSTAPPRLLVVIDEYQEIAAIAPDFMDDLARLAAQGRSLGLHLVLATQRPAGAVTPTVRANLGATLALRVMSEAESRDLLGRPDAAAIPRHLPGRAALWRAGTLVMMQTASPDATASAPVALAGAPQPDGMPLASLARRRWAAATPPSSLWKPPLPAHLRVEDIRAARTGALVIGLADRPHERRYEEVCWDPSSGPLAVVGEDRRSRTAVLASIAAEARRSDIVPVALPHDPREAARTLALCQDVGHLLLVDDAGAALDRLASIDDGAAAEALIARAQRGLPTALTLAPHAPTRLAKGASVTAVLGPLTTSAATTWAVPRAVHVEPTPGRAWVTYAGTAAMAQLVLRAGEIPSERLVAHLPDAAPAGVWAIGGDDAARWAPPGGTVMVIGPAGPERSAVAASIGAHAREADSPVLAPSDATLVLLEPTARAVRQLAPLDPHGVVESPPKPGRVVVIAARRAAAAQLSLDLRVRARVEHHGRPSHHGSGDDRDAAREG